MSEEQLARIESKLDSLSGTVESLAGTVTTLVTGQARLETQAGTLETGQVRLEAQVGRLEAGQARIETQVETLEAGQARLETQVETLEAGQARLETAEGDLRRHMHVLHENVIARMKASDPAPLIAATERRLRALIDDRHEQVLRRLDPIEIAVQELYRRQPAP